MPNPDDTILVQKAKEGDKKAFEELVQTYFGRIYHTAMHIMADTQEAEDVTQETFIKAYRALARFDGRSSFFTWIYRILINLCINRKKEIKKWGLHNENDPRLQLIHSEKQTSSSQSPDEQLEKKRIILSLIKAIDELSDVLRTTLILVVFENLDYKKAGEILGCSEGTVAWRVFRARELLREKLKNVI